ncbi:MAG: T9SS type A sorting domain-containing protein [Bacteroidales bacterium]
MKRTISLILLFIGCLLALNAQTFTEILGRPTNNSITINALFDVQVDAYFEYGEVSGQYTASTAVTSSVVGELVEVMMTGLKAETRYYYRTRYRKPGVSTFLAGAEHTFITQRKSGSKFVFTIEADPHPYDPKGYHPLWDIALNNQLTDGADFMLDLGDTFGDDHQATTITSAEVKQLMLDNRSHFGSVCHSMPFFFCQGNHEGESGYYLLQTPPNNLATYETLWRKMYYPNPFPDGFYTGNETEEPNGIGKPENYYAWEWGDALFVVVDGWRYYTANAKPRNWEWTLGKQQYDWLKQTLETSKAKYKFVFTHHVLGETRGGINIAKTFEWGGLDNGKDKFALNRPGWAMPIHQLMVANNVTAYFQGHDHLYAREEMDNLVYQTVPMPSDSSYQLGVLANASAFAGTVLPGAGHIRVTVSPDSVTVDYVASRLPKDETPTKKNRDILYSYSIKGKASAINQMLLRPDWRIYPNPAREAVNISFPKLIYSSLVLNVYSMDGKMMKKITRNASDCNGSNVNIDLRQEGGRPLPSGIYAVELVVDGKSVSFKKLVVN